MVVLTRINDGLVKKSKEIKFLSFDKNGRGKKFFKKPKVGRSVILSPFSIFYTWQTTEIIEVISDNEFRTKNSHYKFKIE